MLCGHGKADLFKDRNAGICFQKIQERLCGFCVLTGFHDGDGIYDFGAHVFVARVHDSKPAEAASVA